MKKKISMLVFLMVAALLAAAMAGAEAAQAPTLETLSEYDWSFMSGAGGWATYIRINPDGSFTGDYHDSEMGETGDDYPYGTIYGCVFHGQLTLGEQVSDYAWSVHVDAVEMDEGQVPESIEDGTRYMTIEPYGLTAGNDMLLFLPGTPVDELPEEFLLWAHLIGSDETELPNYGLYDEAADTGFIAEEPFEVLEGE